MRREILGYSIGFIGQGASYNFISTYFVLFMTNCVNMSPAAASTIMSLALLIEVAAGMLVGNLSDNCTSRLGKRRPFILLSALILPAVMLLLFCSVSLPAGGKFVYYLILSIAFRIAFACFEIPNGAMGAEIAKGYDERTRLRTVSRIFSITGNAIAYVMPLLVLELLKEHESRAWLTIGAIVALSCLLTWLASFLMTKNASAVLEKKPQKQENLLRNIVANYVELFRLKAFQLLIVYKAAFGIAFAVYNIATIYYLKYCLQIGNTYASYMYMFTITIFIVTTPFANRSAVKIGKANQQKSMMLMAAITGTLIYILAADKVIGAVLYIAAFAVMQTTFWQLSASIFYDIAEVDEFVNGKRREGDIMSLVSVIGTLISSVVVQLFGICLQASGFDAKLAMQPAGVTAFLNAAYILIPSLCFFAGAWALHRFPINKETFASLTEAVKRKKAGQDYSMYQKDLDLILTLKKR